MYLLIVGTLSLGLSTAPLIGCRFTLSRDIPPSPIAVHLAMLNRASTKPDFELLINFEQLSQELMDVLVVLIQSQPTLGRDLKNLNNKPFIYIF